MKIHAFRILVAAVFALLVGVAAQAQKMAPGQIKAAKIEHTVSRVAANGTVTALKDGDLVTETDTIRTEKDSSVVLVFMNGSSVRLGADSELKIEEFQMDPLATGEEIKMADLQAEPTTSRTTLNLTHGELVGSVKHLHTDRGSSYNVKTPVGAAGIRGTIFRIVYTPTSDGKAFFSVQTSEGRVVLTGVTNVEVPIPAGKEVIVTADINLDVQTAAPTASNVTVTTTELSKASTETIAAAVTTITTVITETKFTTPPPPSTPAPETPTPDKPAPDKPAPETPAAPPAPTIKSVDLTPGAGG